MKKRFVSLLVAACMIFALLPVSAITAFAEKPVLTGYCGADSSYPSQTYNYSVMYKSIERTFTGTYYSNAIWTLTPNGENTYKSYDFWYWCNGRFKRLGLWKPLEF